MLSARTFMFKFLQARTRAFGIWDKGFIGSAPALAEQSALGRAAEKYLTVSANYEHLQTLLSWQLHR
jgi:hypothetical protein